MRSKNIVNYVFLAGLLVLILNDHVLKAVYGNWLTGKLSDFAGLLILPMILKFVFPLNTRKAIVGTIFFFIFWKTPLSQLTIDGFNSLDILTISRVVDYTDFVAFLILPLSVYVLDHTEKFAIKIHSQPLQKAAISFVFLLSILTFVATSVPDEPLAPSTSDSLDDCCVFGPTVANVGNGKIFIPSIFTPDGNGMNDYFQISADSNILRIDTFLVATFYGDTIFRKYNITEMTPENGFDGMVLDTVFAVKYIYTVVITSKDSIKRAFNGYVCSVPCDGPLGIPRPENIGNCGFSTQYDPVNGYNPGTNSGEALDCFE